MSTELHGAIVLFAVIPGLAAAASSAAVPCSERLDQAATSLRADQADTLSLIKVLHEQVAEAEAALSLASTAEKAGLVLDNVLDSLALRDQIRCNADRARANNYTARVMDRAAGLLRSYANDTVADVGLTTNATLANLSSKIRDRLRGMAADVEACAP